MRNLLQERKVISFQQQTIDILSKQVEKLQDKLAGNPSQRFVSSRNSSTLR